MDAFFGEIRVFGFNFPPENWAQCNGQTMQIMQYQVLYTILGTQFGGDGKTTFKLPNLQGSTVCQAGQGPGLTSRQFGSHPFGTTSVTLTQSQMPNHQHTFNATSASAAQATNSPTATSHLGRTLKQLDFTNTDIFDTTMAPQMVGITGGSTPHENRQPFLAMNFCICIYGEYPVRAS